MLELTRVCVSVLIQVCYAKELKEGFMEYTEDVVKLMVPLLKFYFHDDILLLHRHPMVCKNENLSQRCVFFPEPSPRVRVAAAESMPLLLECAQVRGPEYLTQMWHFMCDALIKSIGTEPDSDVLSEIMHSFAKVSLAETEEEVEEEKVALLSLY